MLHIINETSGKEETLTLEPMPPRLDTSPSIRKPQRILRQNISPGLKRDFKSPPRALNTQVRV